jgi:hypothetical protein
MKKLLMLLMFGIFAQACARQSSNEPSESRSIGQTRALSKVEPVLPRKRDATDPRSSEAALELVEHFAALLNQRRFDEAYMLLGPGAPPRTKFDSQFSRYSDLKVSAGAPGEQEGAAGSIYLSIPLEVSGLLDGERSTRSATAILRRVNDVPGSTEAQRRWHIERITWGSER